MSLFLSHNSYGQFYYRNNKVKDEMEVKMKIGMGGTDETHDLSLGIVATIVSCPPKIHPPVTLLIDTNC